MPAGPHRGPSLPHRLRLHREHLPLPHGRGHHPLAGGLDRARRRHHARPTTSRCAAPAPARGTRVSRCTSSPRPRSSGPATRTTAHVAHQFMPVGAGPDRPHGGARPPSPADTARPGRRPRPPRPPASLRSRLGRRRRRARPLLRGRRRVRRVPRHDRRRLHRASSPPWRPTGTRSGRPSATVAPATRSGWSATHPPGARAGSCDIVPSWSHEGSCAGAVSLRSGASSSSCS